MSIEAALLGTPTISFISYGKIMFDFRAHFQERNYRVNREVAVLNMLVHK
jgi:predicted glycosyltransferase